MTNQEIAENTLKEMYIFIMSGISAASAALDGKTGTGFTVWMGGVDGVKDLLTHPNENHYEAVGRTVGNMIGIVATLTSAKYIKSITMSVKARAGGAFVTNEVISHASLGDTFANLFNTYVANTDAFYEKILTDAEYSEKIWNGIVANGLNNYVNYFDPDHDGVVSAQDIVNGYKQLFSPPPAFGTAEFVVLYSPVDKTQITIKGQEEGQKELIKKVTEYDQIKKVTLNNQTYDITSDNNTLLVRNALDKIPSVSILLSHIDIDVGDKIDLGLKGIYIVEGGDTFSEIANANGFNTKQLLELNTWLIDEGKVDFDQNKVLVDVSDSDLGRIDHTLIGENVDDILKDHNGGDDTLIGNSGDDHLDGGTGSDTLIGGKDYDTYIADNGDMIYDSDGLGTVNFEGLTLTGGTAVAGQQGVYKGSSGETYTLTSDSNLRVKNSNGSTTTIYNFNKEKNHLGITLEDNQLLEVTVYAPIVKENSSIATGSVVLSKTVTQTTTIILHTQDNTAIAGTDFVANSSIVAVVKAGTNYATFDVEILDDDIAEVTEGFYVLVDSVKEGSTDINFTVKDVQEFIIEDDDEDANVVKVKVSDATLNEADGEMIFTISLIGELNEGDTLKVNLETYDISAIKGDDYDETVGYVEFSSNDVTPKIIKVPIKDDDERNEGDETFYLSPTSIEYNGTKQIFMENAGTGTITDDDTGATPQDDILILTDEDDVMDALAGDDYVEGKAGNDTISGNLGDDILWGGADNDMLYGDEGSDILFGDSGNDYLEGGTGNDTLYGGEGADVLLGGDGSDYLNGGSGFDYYITGSGDIVEDSDGKGAVFFNNVDLTGTKKLQKGSTTIYEDGVNTYEETGGGLLVTSASGESITIAGYSNGALGIELNNSDDSDDSDDSDGNTITVSVGDAEAFEADEMMRAKVTLGRELRTGEELVVDLGYYKTTYSEDGYGAPVTVSATSGSPKTSEYNEYYGKWTVIPAIPPRAAYTYTYTPIKYVASGEEFVKVASVTFKEGEQEKTYTYDYTWRDDTNPNSSFYYYEDDIGDIIGRREKQITLTAKENEEDSNHSDNIKVIPIREGTLTIKEDDTREENRYDPLVLDTNKDGFISTTSLDDSNTYFDLTGDGLRERVGWIKSEDALLALDKNENGQIDGIGEVFGSVTESGFDELRRVVDSNYDNKIDKRDELFNSLQVWNDINGDARVQEGELRSLDEAGITSIDLNALETNIDLNGNILSEASKYTDAAGNKELVADILLNTDIKDTKVDVDDIPNYTVDETTRELPQFAGSGLVYDSFILYNIDEEFKISNNISTCRLHVKQIKQNKEVA